MAEMLGMTTWQVPFPTLKKMVPQIALFFVFEDFFHFLGIHCRFVSRSKVLFIKAFFQLTKPFIGVLSTNTFTSSSTSIPPHSVLQQSMRIPLKCSFSAPGPSADRCCSAILPETCT